MPDFSSAAYVDPVGVETDYATVQDGPWDDAATWGGTTPTESSNVRIDHAVTIRDTTPICRVCAVTVNASLTFAKTASTKFQVQTLFLLGKLDIGSEGSPVTGDVEIVFRNLPIDVGTTSDSFNSGYDPAQYGNGLVIRGEGECTIWGQAKTPFVSVADGQFLTTGLTEVTFSESVSGWKAGDEIAIPDCRTLLDDEDETYAIREVEIVNLATDFDSATVSFSPATQHTHITPTYYGSELEHIKLVNLSRNVLIRSENPSTGGTRGHILYTASAHVMIGWVEIKNMGRTENRLLHQTLFDGSGTPTMLGKNPIARYALHTHHTWGRRNEGDLDYFSNYPYTTKQVGVVVRDDMPDTTVSGSPSDTAVILSNVSGSGPTFTCNISEPVIAEDIVVDSSGDQFAVAVVNGSTITLDQRNFGNNTPSEGAGSVLGRELKLASNDGFPTTYPYDLLVHNERMTLLGLAFNGVDYTADVLRSSDWGESHIWSGVDLGNEKDTPKRNVPGACEVGQRAQVYSRSKWAQVIHDTHWSLVEKCVTYDIKGAAFVSEQNERENVYQDNHGLLVYSLNSFSRHSIETSNDGSERYTGREPVAHWSRMGFDKWYRRLSFANCWDNNFQNTAFGFEIVQERYDEFTPVPSQRGNQTMGGEAEQFVTGEKVPYEISNIHGHSSDNGATCWWIGASPYGQGTSYAGVAALPSERWGVRDSTWWGMTDFTYFHYPESRSDMTGVEIHESIYGVVMGDYDWWDSTLNNSKFVNCKIGLLMSYFANATGYSNTYREVEKQGELVPSLDKIYEIRNVETDCNSANIQLEAHSKSSDTIGKFKPHKEWHFIDCVYGNNFGGNDFRFNATQSAGRNFWCKCKYVFKSGIVHGQPKSPTYERRAWYDIQRPEEMMKSNEGWRTTARAYVGSPEVSRLSAAASDVATTLSVQKNDGTVVGEYLNNKTIPDPTLMNYGSLQWAAGQVWQTRGTAGVDWEPFFVRCNDEVMQVDNIVDATTHWELTVLRGQFGTTPQAHSAEDLIGTTNRSMWNRYEPDLIIEPYPDTYPLYALKSQWYATPEDRDPAPGLCTFAELVPESYVLDTDFSIGDGNMTGFIEAVSD